VQNEYDPGEGLGAGDHGFLAHNQPGVPELTPRPSYFPFYFFTRNFGTALLTTAKTGGPSAQVAVYASTWYDDVLAVIAINKSASPVTLNLTINGAPHPTRGNLWLLTAPSVDSPVSFLNGIGNDLPAGGPDPTGIAPYSMAFEGEPTLGLPAYSVASVLLYE
jgi:hypothetical protein